MLHEVGLTEATKNATLGIKKIHRFTLYLYSRRKRYEEKAAVIIINSELNNRIRLTDSSIFSEKKRAIVL